MGIQTTVGTVQMWCGSSFQTRRVATGQKLGHRQSTTMYDGRSVHDVDDMTMSAVYRVAQKSSYYHES